MYHKFASAIVGLGERTGRTFDTYAVMAQNMRDAGMLSGDVEPTLA